MKLYIVSQQYYEEFYIYGVFSKDKLDDAITVLAKRDLGYAEKAKQESEKWYKSHLDYFSDCEYGCDHMPYSLKVPLLEYSKSRFDITKIILDEILDEPRMII